ncbi:MAG: hypothetical protein KF689_09055 [Gemmatimonadaceae bacterium]|nr:hypothetical protein [Gemmatimonadaceae bacterium]MCW5826255.1 hypothetical protein [Gemmatimonadaceae bacterium]
MPRLPLLALAAAAIIAATILLTLALRRALAARRLAAQMQLAASGEHAAERFLVAAGFTIVARQHTLRATMHINGRVAEYDVRADFLVERSTPGGPELALVEVKTGDAADPRTPATRRQLREYAALYDIDRLYLFDASANRLHEIEFPC